MTETTGPHEPERAEPDPEFEAQFAQLMKDVEEGRKAAVEEPSARARTLAAEWREQPPASTPWRGDVPRFGDDAPIKPAERTGSGRVWLRNLAIAVIVGALTVGVVETLRHNGSRDVPAAASAGVGPSLTQGAGTAAGAAPGTVSQIPVSQLFPQTVHGAGGTTFTLVTAGPLNSCTNSDMVGPTLAGLFAQSAGCLGGEGALYKDSAKDQFNMTVFTLKDQVDVISILTELSMNPGDFEVGALQPPAGSGLTTLSATSGIIQQFASSGHYLGVFMAQWSDGRAADYGSLQQLLDPLQGAVAATMKRES
jgi:hypothetical protein